MQVILKWVTPDAEKVIVDCARVSSDPTKATRPDIDLIRYLIRNRHVSPFEMASACFEIANVSRAVTRQILRHRSLHFQEFCITGDSAITLELPGGIRRGERSSYKRTIEHLHSLQKRGRRLPLARVYDEAKSAFVVAPIREVFQTGLKPVFRVTLENGRTITATKEHKFLTPCGFKTMEDALGLTLVANTPTWTNRDAAFGCNGVAAYTDRDWLAKAKAQAIDAGTGLQGIADAAGVSTHTIRVWLRKMGLQFTRLEVASYTPIWNKGRRWSRRPHSPETIEKMRRSARRGDSSNLWRGGVERTFRQAASDWCNSRRAEFLAAANYACARCGGHRRLELHHVETVASRPDLAMVPSNIEVLCRACHIKHHQLTGERKVWASQSKGNVLTTHWAKVRSVEYVGERMTYDMEVDHVSHNYVANGIVTHNSQRYQDAQIAGGAMLTEARMQHPTNRQASLDTASDEDRTWWAEAQWEVATTAHDIYRRALAKGIAKEVARVVLPEGMTPTRMHMTGTVRDWLHYCDVRRGNGTQPEHVAIADAAWSILRRELPVITAAWEGGR